MTITLINKTHSATKRGPGRVHAQGLKKAPKPKSGGAGVGFVQYENPKRGEHRATFIAARGIRQWRRLQQSVRRMFPEAT